MYHDDHTNNALIDEAVTLYITCRLAEEIIEERRQAAQKYLNDLREAKARQEWAEEMRKKFD